MKIVKLLVCIIVMFLMSGCLGDNGIAEKTMVNAAPFRTYQDNQATFGYLHRAMSENNNFTAAEKVKLINAEGALISEFEYMQEITNVADSVPYYSYKESYSRIKRNVKIMSDILNAHIREYPEETQYLYIMTMKIVVIISNSMDVSIYQADENISAANTSKMISDFSKLYSAVKPLMSAAAVAL